MDYTFLYRLDPRRIANNTRLEALYEQLASGKMENDRAKILDLFRENPQRGFTEPNIREHFRMKSRTSGARLSELKEMGAIKVIGKKKIAGTHREVYGYVSSEAERFQRYRDHRIKAFSSRMRNTQNKYPDLWDAFIENLGAGRQTALFTEDDTEGIL